MRALPIWRRPRAHGNLGVAPPHKADGTVTYTRLRGGSSWRTWTSPVRRRSRSLRSPGGQKIAFVGATGAGKATITNLINRFYDIAAARSATTASTSTRSTSRIVAPSASSCKTLSSLGHGHGKHPLQPPGRHGRRSAIAAAKLASADSFIRRLPEDCDADRQRLQATLAGPGSALSIARRRSRNPTGDDPRRDPPRLTRVPGPSYSRAWTTLMEGAMLRDRRCATPDAIMVLDHGRIIEAG